VPPVQVKVWGLFRRTRTRYLAEAVIGALCLAAALVIWWLGWPGLRHRLVQHELTPKLRLTVAVLDLLPWIVLGAAALKALEVAVVLRRFAAREREAAAKGDAPSGPV
jgi:hypothetical protein